MTNNDLNIDEIAKTMSNALKKLTEVLGSFNEEKIKEILMKSRKPTLSEAERVILENIDKEYKWIARDKDGTLKIGTDKFEKSDRGFWYHERCLKYNNIGAFNHLFQFITWNDSEPYNIEELLKENEKWEK